MSRYARQIQLKDFGPEKQLKLKNSKVIVVGAGGLGVPVLQYLTAMGIGTLGIIENDAVSLTNLQRQVLYTERQATKQTSKLNAAVKRLKKLNSEVLFKTFPAYLSKDNALETLNHFDLIVDCSDNFETRYLVNDACVMLNKPFIYGALHGYEGHVSVLNYKNGPTYRCLFPQEPGVGQIPDCETNGVLGVIPGIIGNFQALEAVKVLTGLGTPLAGKLLIYDGLEQTLRKIKVPLNPENLTITELKSTLPDNSCGSEFNEVNIQTLNQLLFQNGVKQLIDVRNTSEYNLFSIPGSHNIPLNQIPERFGEISQQFPVYLVCESGIRSKKALHLLKKLNPELELFNVEGGLIKYKEKYTPDY